MAEFLNAFLPTLAFMLVPLLIPVVAVTAGWIGDLVRANRRPTMVAAPGRARIAQPEVASDVAQAA